MNANALFNKVSFLGVFTAGTPGLQSTPDLELYGMLPSCKDLRWLVPLKSNKLIVSSLAMYQPSLTKAKLMKRAAILMARLGLFKLLIKNRAWLQRDDAVIRQIFGKDDLEYAIFSGTSGSHRKVTLQVMDNRGDILAYMKVSDNAHTDSLLRNEAGILHLLSNYPIGSGFYPKVIYSGKIGHVTVLALDTKKDNASDFSRILTEDHILFLQELFKKTSKSWPFDQSPFFERLKLRAGAANSLLTEEWRTRLRDIITRLGDVLGNRSLPFGLCHRDFTPWNTFFHARKLYVFDWEYAEHDYPPMLDIFHFLLQDGIITEKLTVEALFDKIGRHSRLVHEYADAIAISRVVEDLMLLCYLADISLLYFEKERGRFSAEVKRVLDTWGCMIDRLVAAA